MKARVLQWKSIAGLLLAWIIWSIPAGRTAASPSSVSYLVPPAGESKLPLDFENISLEQGLSQSSVLCILQDRQGFMWFGTQDGLNKYDGYGFTVYRHVPEDPHSLSNNFVWTLFEDSDGSIWVGTNGGGLDRFNRDTGRFTHYRTDYRDSSSISSNYVNTIFQDSLGIMWIGTNGGLNRYDRENDRFDHYLEQRGSPKGPNHNNIQVIFEDSEQTLWLGTDGGGLSSYDRISDRFTHFVNRPLDPQSLSHNHVKSILEDHNGALWIATNGGGLNRLDRATGQFTRFTHDPNDVHSLSNNSLWSILQERDGALWVATYGGGLDHFDPSTETFTHYRADILNPQSLSDDFIASLYKDQTGTLWVGTFGGGVNRVDTSAGRFTHYYTIPNQANSLANNMVWAIIQDSHNLFWIGSNGGLDRFDRTNNQWRHYQHDPDDPYSLSSNSIGSILEDSNGTMWVGTAAGSLDKFDPVTGTFIRYQITPDSSAGSRAASILAIYEDSKGKLWLGSAYGLHHFDHSNGRFANFYGLTTDYVRSIFEDRDGYLWIGTVFGLNRIDPQRQQVKQYISDPTQPNSLSDNTVLSIHQDSSGILWLGTSGGGLDKFDPVREKFTHYREKDGLPNNVVYGVLEDDQGYLWLSTNHGLSKFDPRKETFVNFYISDGLQSWEFNAGAYWKSASGEMLFGGVNGLNIFDPAEVTVNPLVPPVVLTSLTHNGQNLTSEIAPENIHEIRLVWPENSFEFEYTALNYRQAEKNQYAFTLVNFDNGWNYVGTKRFGRYTNLPGGNYVLRIRGSNNDGVWNEEGVAVAVTVVPPFWASWWFRGSMALCLVGGVFVYYRLRMRSIHARTRELESLVDARTFEIQQRRQELEALYRADAELHRRLSLNEVLQALVDIAVNLLKADKSSLMVKDRHSEQFVVRVAHNYHASTLERMSFAPGVGTVGHVASTGEPIIIEDTITDPRIVRHDILAAEGIRSLMRVPITIGGKVFGVFSADYTQPRAFGGEEIRLFVALAQRAALAIETAQLYEQTQELAVMEERSRLARDLHDAVTQTLFSAGLIAEALPTSWEKDQQTGQELLNELRQLTRGALAEMRTLLLELRPAGLTDAQLGDLLKQLAEAVTGREGIPVSVTITNCEDGLGEPPSLPPDVHIGLYRITQEALNNVVKHARASQVTVNLHCVPAHNGRDAQTVTLCVGDNGCGFDPTQIAIGRLGLEIMQERAQRLGAELTIDSRPGAGAKITVVWNNHQGEHHE